MLKNVFWNTWKLNCLSIQKTDLFTIYETPTSTSDFNVEIILSVNTISEKGKAFSRQSARSEWEKLSLNLIEIPANEQELTELQNFLAVTAIDEA